MKKFILSILAVLALSIGTAFAGGPTFLGGPWQKNASGNWILDSDNDGTADVTIDGSTGAVTFASTVAMGTARAGLVVTSDADGVVLTSADWGKFILMTGAGEVALPDAGASDIGKYVTVMVRDASEQVEVVLTDATELFVLTAGTALTAGNEVDMPTAAGSQATFVYLETGKWYLRGESGISTDGGAAD